MLALPYLKRNKKQWNNSKIKKIPVTHFIFFFMSSIEEKKAQLKALKEARELKQQQLLLQHHQQQAVKKLDEVENTAVASSVSSNETNASVVAAAAAASRIDNMDDINILDPSDSSAKKRQHIASVAVQTERNELNNNNDDESNILFQDRTQNQRQAHAPQSKQQQQSGRCYDQTTQTTFSTLLFLHQAQSHQKGEALVAPNLEDSVTLKRQSSLGATFTKSNTNILIQKLQPAQNDSTSRGSVRASAGGFSTTKRRRRQQHQQQQLQVQRQYFADASSLRERLAIRCIEGDQGQNQHQQQQQEQSPQTSTKVRTFDQFLSLIQQEHSLIVANSHNGKNSNSSSSSSAQEMLNVRFLDSLLVSPKNESHVSPPLTTTSISFAPPRSTGAGAPPLLLLAAAHSNNLISIFDVASGKKLQSVGTADFDVSTSGTTVVTKLKFLSYSSISSSSPKNSSAYILVAGTNKGQIFVWELKIHTSSPSSSCSCSCRLVYQSFPSVEGHCEAVTTILEVPPPPQPASISTSSAAPPMRFLTFAGSTVCSWSLTPPATTTASASSLSLLFPSSSVAVCDSNEKPIRVADAELMLTTMKSTNTNNNNNNNRSNNNSKNNINVVKAKGDGYDDAGEPRIVVVGASSTSGASNLFFSKPLSYFIELRGRRVDMESFVAGSSGSPMPLSSIVSVSCSPPQKMTQLPRLVTAGSFEGSLIVVAATRKISSGEATGNLNYRTNNNNNNNNNDNNNNHIRSILAFDCSNNNSNNSYHLQKLSSPMTSATTTSSAHSCNRIGSSSRSELISSKWQHQGRFLVTAHANGRVSFFTAATASGQSPLEAEAAARDAAPLLVLKKSFFIEHRLTKAANNNLPSATATSSTFALSPIEVDIVELEGTSCSVVAVGTGEGIVQTFIVSATSSLNEMEGADESVSDDGDDADDDIKSLNNGNNPDQENGARGEISPEVERLP